jgi:hypothetical protein
MTFRNVGKLSIVLLLIFGLTAQLSAQGKSGQYLSVEHSIITKGLPLVGPVKLTHTQDIYKDSLCRSSRNSVITLGDSVLSNVTTITIHDLNGKKQMFVNPAAKEWAVRMMRASEFPVIDSAADARRPQMKIEKTGETKTIDGKKCDKITFRLDHARNTGVGEAKVKHYFEGFLWVTKEIPNHEMYNSYNLFAHKFLRGTNNVTGSFFDILIRLDLDEYNLNRLLAEMEGIPVEGTIVAQMPTGQGADVFETNIKLLNYSTKAFGDGHFAPPRDCKEVPIKEFKSF